jgi:hypothetical protein
MAAVQGITKQAFPEHDVGGQQATKIGYSHRASFGCPSAVCGSDGQPAFPLGVACSKQ